MAQYATAMPAALFAENLRNARVASLPSVGFSRIWREVHAWERSLLAARTWDLVWPLLPVLRCLILPNRSTIVNQSSLLHENRRSRLGLLHLFRVVSLELVQAGLGSCLILGRQLGLRPIRVAVSTAATRRGSGIYVPGQAAVLLDTAVQIGNLGFLLLSIVQDGFHLGWQ